MTSTLKPCPFCGGTAHIRRKIRYRTNEEHPEGTVFEFNPTYGEYEQTVKVFDWAFGYQAWCGRCKAKLPYKWGNWHSYSEDELETLDRSDFYRHTPTAEDESAKDEAIKAWNKRDYYDFAWPKEDA